MEGSDVSAVADDLKEAMVDAYLSYVESRVEAQQLELPETFEDALVAGRLWLRSSLEDLLARPYAQQRRGPLEVFQEAMRFPTEALSVAGVEPAARDAGAEAALPGDLFNLAPASSRQISEEVWLAHLAWGEDKARGSQERRRVVLLADNLMDRTRIESVVTRTGADLTAFAVALPDPLPDLLVVDLEHKDAINAVETFSEAGVRVIAFGPHADRERLEEARRAGAEVIARSAFFTDPSRFLF
jgi:hypothetical protein